MVWISASCSLLLLFAAATAMLPSAHSDKKFFDKICSEIGDGKKDMCLEMLLSSPPVTSCNDLTCAASISAGVCLEHAMNTNIFLKKLKDMGVETPKSMATCTDVYAAIEANLGIVIKNMFDGDYVGASRTISRVKDPNTCEAAFEAHPNAMTISNKRMEEMLYVISKFLVKITS